MKERFRIGELAHHSGCPVETIRYYEREGLLVAPTRTSGNYRLYDKAHVAQLTLIRNCRSLDMTLAEIRALLGVQALAESNCEAAHRLLDEHIAHVADRILELRSLERKLKSLRRQCVPARDTDHCQILDDLGRDTLRVKGKPAMHHVKGAHR